MSTPSHRIAFAGSPQLAATVLAAMLGHGHRPLLVLTQPDRRAGRGRRLQPGPVKALACEHGLAVDQPPTLRERGVQDRLASLQLDVLVVAAYGLILPPEVLAIPRFGCLNVHASVLPRWRGASPVQAAILAGDRHSGVSIMQMDAGLDTGAVRHVLSCPVYDDDTAARLEARLAVLGGEALCAVLDDLGGERYPALAQDAARASYAGRIAKRDGALDFAAPAVDLERRVRAYQPWPVAYTEVGGERLRVLAAAVREASPGAAPGTVLAASREGLDIATGDGVLRLLQVQRPGGRPVTAAEYLNARPLERGARIGSDA